MTHRYELPMRWADLDQLNHVNNVVYLQYAAEARAALVAGGHIDTDLETVETSIDFRAPMMLSTRPVVVLSAVDGTVVDQQVVQQIDDRQVEFARVQVRLGRREPLGAPQVAGVVVPFRGRRADLDTHGLIDPTRYFEYFQEARILSLATHWVSGTRDTVVVARLEVTYARPVRWRPEPWEVAVDIVSVGSKSVDVRCEWRDRDTVVARNSTVMVGFDAATQRSRAWTDAERVALEGFAGA